jgi:hypothetical protein
VGLALEACYWARFASPFYERMAKIKPMNIGVNRSIACERRVTSTEM